MKVRIKQLPKKAYGGQQAGGALNVTPAKWGGSKNNAREGKEVKQSLTKVPRSMANLEAEGGETAFGPISGDTIPDHFKITGPRHSSGGVPLNLPEDTFIFSDTKAMKIRDPQILRIFGKPRKKGGYTPAELAKPYDINKYKGILMDKDSDRRDRENAELMIKNYIMKLGALAIAQESKKGFPQGIPEMARPYMEANGISEEDLMPEQQPEEGQMPQEGQEQMSHGGDFHSPFGGEGFDPEIAAKALETKGAMTTEKQLVAAAKAQTNPERYRKDPITGERSRVTEEEALKGQDISYEVGIKNAYDVDGNMLADQGAYLAGVATNIGEQVKTSKRMKSIFDKSVDQDAREDVFSGLHYANTPGVVAPSGVSPTSVQYKRSQYGGALDKFVYGGYDEPITPVADDPNYANIDFSSLNPEQSAIAQSKEFRMDPRAFRGQVPFGVRRQQRKANKDLMSKGQGIYGIDLEREKGVPPYNFDKQSREQNREVRQNNRQARRDERPPRTGTSYPINQANKHTWFSKNIGQHFKGRTEKQRYGAKLFQGRKIKQYGGEPMSTYGMEMGGAYYPTMSTGGSSRVRITALPRKDEGGPKVSREDAKVAGSQSEYDAATGNGWKEYTDANGKKWKVRYVEGKEVAGSKVEAKVFNDTLTSTTQLNKALCARMAKGEGEKNSLANYSAADVIAKFYPAVAKNPDSQKYKDLEAQLAGCVNMVGGEKTDEIIDSIKYDPDKGCRCKILDADGNWTGEYEEYEGTINEETGELECPDCEYEEETKIPQPETFIPEEPARWSQRAIGNLLTQGRFRTDAERLDPFLVDEPEYSPVLQRRYDQDIQSNLSGLRGSIDSGGGTAQQKLFQNLAALDQATTQVGKRQKQTEDYNINVLNQAAQIASNLQQGTDARNQQSMMNARRYNAQAGDTETAAKNAKMQAMNLAKTDAQNEMLQKATWNFNNPEFQIGYRDGMPYYVPHSKEANPTRGQKDITEEYKRILGLLGDNEDNREVAYNLAVKSVYGNKSKQYGGYISGDDTYPFFND